MFPLGRLKTASTESLLISSKPVDHCILTLSEKRGAGSDPNLELCFVNNNG